MRKNGFTLIEMLAVIIILLIIVIISTPNIINLVNKSSDLTKNAIEEKLIDAAKEYITSYNRSILNSLVTVGSKETIVSDTLVAAGLIKQSDIDLLEENTVFVEITLQEDNKIDYVVQYDPALLQVKNTRITLLGGNPFYVEIGHPYIEPGFVALNSIDQDITKNVNISGNVFDTTTIGSYTITYKVVDNGNTTQVTRTVIVRDSAPLGIASATIVTNNALNNKRAKNGDTVTLSMTFTKTITNTPTVTIGGRAATVTGSGITRTATYTVSSSESTLTEGTLNINITNYIDLHNNVGTAITSVTSGGNVIYDRTKPVITLLGSNPITITVGTKFSDPGVTAMDNIDNSVTHLIIATGIVNTSTVGTYQVTYNVSDLAGNAATPAVRTVNVQ